MEIDVALAARATIGEAPTWDPADHALYWIDVKAPALHRLDVPDGASRTWPVTSDIGAFALMPDRCGAVVALREGIFRLDFASGSLERLAPPPFDTGKFRFNEGACDETGRFWIGVMFDPVEKGAEPQRASLHSFTLEGGMRREPDAAELHNGMAWSPDGGTFYLSHSQQHEVFAFSFDKERPALTGRRSFVKASAALGVPDGAAVDVEGAYWCAFHGGGRLRRYTAAGALDMEILLPVSQPTMCAFGGPELDSLYITSARDGLTPEQLEREPLAGAVLRVRPGHVGIPRRCTLR